MILVKASIEGKVHHLLCEQLGKDPILEGRILIAGFDLILPNGDQPIRLMQLSLRPEDIHYYSTVQPAEAPDQKTAPPPPATPSVPLEEGANGVDKSKKTMGRKGRKGKKKGAEVPEA